MKIIGITGGVGAGKTTVLNQIKEMCNCRILIADEIAKNLQLPGEECYEKIVKLLGTKILCGELGTAIDNKKMAQIIFADKKLLQEVNSIIHPSVKKYINNIINTEKGKGEIDYLFIEAALLIDDGYDVICDEMWYIYVNEEIRIERLAISRGYSREKSLSIMSKQNSDEVFRKYCKYVIDNNGDMDKTVSDIKFALKG